ncbi:MAG: TonB-dependent receptor [Saprospiraceae bacterium]|nr:TonB-dependent receptor [Saprospiraceae bacterium]
MKQSCSISALCLALCLSFSSLNAQNRISGTLLDSQGEPVAAANVLLLTANDSSLIFSMLSGEHGEFLFNDFPAGRYLLGFYMIGFEKSYSIPFDIGLTTSEFKLGNVVMQESSSLLEEVSVVAKRPFLEQKIDRTVINVANTITNAGGTALQVLQRSPGVQVNALSKTISLAGKQGVVLMINGKISRLPADAVVDLLSGMNSDNIDHIELIHTPPANFEAEGNAGIINIVLKTNDNQGLSGGYSANAGYGFGPKYGGSGYLNFRRKKMNWYAGYEHMFNLNPQVFTNYRGVQQNNQFLETETYSDRPHTPFTSQNARLGADFQLSPKTVVGVLGTFFDSDWYMEAVNHVRYATNGQTTGQLKMPNIETNHNRSFSTNVNLLHQFGKSQSLNLDLDYVDYKINNPSEYDVRDVDAQGAENSLYKLRIDKKTPIQVGVAKADYTTNIGEKGKLETGVKLTLLRFENDVQVDSLPALQQEWVVLPDFTSLFTLKEEVAGAYMSYSTKFGEKIDFKAGLRYEYTSSNLGSVEMPNVVDRQYGSWFPSVFLSHRISEKQQLNLSYSRRISRPQIRRLAPWLIFSDPTTFEGGNPALQPSFNNSINLQYSINSWNVGLSYSIENQPMRSFPNVDRVKNRQFNSYLNFDLETVLSANVYKTFQPVTWWNVSANGYVNHVQLDFTNEGKSLQIESLNYGFGLNNSFKLPKKFALEITGNYDAPSYWGLAKWRATGSLNIALEKNMGDKWGKIRLAATDLFLSSNWFGTADQPEIQLLVESSYQMAERTFMLSWTNTFGNKKLKSARNRQTGAAEEMRRL